MEEPVQVWRVKILSRKQAEPKPAKPNDIPICPEGPSCNTCQYVKSKTCGSNEEHLKCKKSPTSDPSLLSLKNSVAANCYFCCCNLKEFFKEVFKAIGGDPNNRVCDILCNITDTLLAIANDFVLFLRRICKCFLENMNKKD